MNLEKYLDRLAKKMIEDTCSYDTTFHKCEGSDDWKCYEEHSGELMCYWLWDESATLHQVSWCPFCGIEAKVKLKKE